jgi:hypothetical protein
VDGGVADVSAWHVRRPRVIAALYLISFAGLFCGAGTAISQPLPEASGSTIGFPTVAAALEALRGRPDVRISVQGGWTIADDRANNTVWSFSPEGYPAYPAAVKREITQSNGAIYIKMSILCGGTKVACDKLVIDFQKLNEAMKQHLGQPQ